MKQRFLAGQDEGVDYAAIDAGGLEGLPAAPACGWGGGGPGEPLRWHHCRCVWRADATGSGAQKWMAFEWGGPHA